MNGASLPVLHLLTSGCQPDSHLVGFVKGSCCWSLFTLVWRRHTVCQYYLHFTASRQSSQKPPNICTDDLVWEVINKCVMKMDECLKFGFFKIINSLKAKAIVLHMLKNCVKIYDKIITGNQCPHPMQEKKKVWIYMLENLLESKKTFIWFILFGLTRFDLFAGQPCFFFFYLFLESSMWHPSHCINRVVSLFSQTAHTCQNTA